MSQTIQYIIVGGIFAIMILLVICSKVNKKKSGKSRCRSSYLGTFDLFGCITAGYTSGR